ncbi:MAG: acyl carrier protein [Nanoarchaeota archaeon]
MNTETKLVSIISTVLSLQKEKVTKELSQENEKAWDSVNHLLLINEIEKEFKLTIPLEASITLTSYKKILDFLNKHA